MTKLDRPVVRETNLLEERSRRPLVIKLDGPFVYFRWKGTRKWYEVPLRGVVGLGYRLAAIALQEAKQKAKAERKSR